MEGADRARSGFLRPLLLVRLTDPEFKIVEGMLVDLLDAFGQGEGEVGQGTQVPPLVLTLLEQTREGCVMNAAVSAAGLSALTLPTCP